MNKEILTPGVQSFLRQHEKDDAGKIALGKSPFPDVSSRELAEQVDGRQRSEKKLPLWFHSADIYYPPKLSMEQCSSEFTADYKAKLLKGDKVIDLTGGLGVDAFYFSKQAAEITHCEQNEELSDVALHNATVLGAANIRFLKQNSIEFLKNTEENFDTIYIDPSRRVQNQKVFLLKETEPNVVENLPLFLSKASRVIIKTSPLFDIQSGLRELSNVTEVHVVSVKNDCKELLWVIDRDYEEETRVISAATQGGKFKTMTFTLAEERDIKLESYSRPLAYLYEPDVALLKAGAFKIITDFYKVQKLNQHTHLYTSDTVVDDFIGKMFKVVEVLDYKLFVKTNFIKKANVLSRNFPLKPEELKKKHKISDGGETFLIFTKVGSEQLITIRAELI